MRAQTSWNSAYRRVVESHLVGYLTYRVIQDTERGSPSLMRGTTESDDLARFKTALILMGAAIVLLAWAISPVGL